MARLFICVYIHFFREAYMGRNLTSFTLHGCSIYIVTYGLSACSFQYLYFHFQTHLLFLTQISLSLISVGCIALSRVGRSIFGKKSSTDMVYQEWLEGLISVSLLGLVIIEYHSQPFEGIDIFSPRCVFHTVDLFNISKWTIGSGLTHHLHHCMSCVVYGRRLYPR